MAERILRVSQVNRYIAKKLRDDLNLKNIKVEGEIVAFKKSGPNYYFMLREGDYSVNCAIWVRNIPKVDMKLMENGKKVVVLCDISPYDVNSSYKLSVKSVKAIGEGELMAEFNRVKAKLESEGLFDTIYKKPIPVFPRRVGVVTSATGAAVEDIRKIITAKNDLTDIIIFPTVVQGTEAVKSICANIKTANMLSKGGFNIDTLIVGRGGGSPEDLAAFNDEEVARAIFASAIPVISAVGHEIDFSISDFVADKRAETPTAAADMAVMDTFQLREEIRRSKRLLLTSAGQKIAAERRFLDGSSQLLSERIKAKVSAFSNDVERAKIIIRENDPNNIFAKGYAAVTDKNGMIVSGVANIRKGDEYRVRMSDGSFTAVVTEVEKSRKA